MRFDEKYYLDILLFYRILANDVIVAKNTKIFAVNKYHLSEEPSM